MSDRTTSLLRYFLLALEEPSPLLVLALALALANLPLEPRTGTDPRFSNNHGPTDYRILQRAFTQSGQTPRPRETPLCACTQLHAESTNCSTRAIFSVSLLHICITLHCQRQLALQYNRQYQPPIGRLHSCPRPDRQASRLSTRILLLLT